MLFNPLIGTFFLCFGLLVYEIFCSRLLAIVVGNHVVIFVIAFAMLGMATATSFMSLSGWPPKDTVKWRELSLICILLGISYAGSLFLITLLNSYFNGELASSMAQGGLNSLAKTIQDSILLKCTVYGVFLFIPYFIFGVAIALLFKTVSALEYHKVYFADLSGAAAGCLLCVLCFEYGGYPFVFSLILTATFLSALFFVPENSKYLPGIAIILCIMTFVVIFNPAINRFLEPQPELSQLARDYDKTQEVNQEWHTWNSYSRVALLSMSKNRQSENKYVYALDNGDGWASVPDYKPGYNTLKNLTIKSQAELAVMFNPRKALVIFAGVGDDMVEMDRICQGSCQITGVELNNQMVNNALKNEKFGLKKFFDQPHINLAVAEGREFLEQDKNKYNSILLSWSGASIAYYVGTSGQTTQYLYTKEAFESLIEHLTPDGVLVISNSSKAQALIILRSIFEEQKWGPLKESVVILKSKHGKNNSGNSAWDSGWDQNRLIVSPGGFDKNKLSVIQETASHIGYSVIFSPEYTHPDYMAYQQIVEGDNLEQFQRDLIKNRGIEFSVITDNRPYILDFTPRFLFFNPSQWFETSGITIRNQAFRYMKVLYYQFLLGLMAVAIVLIICPLLLRSGPRPTWRNLNHLIFFFCLGSGFILIEVGFIQKLRLLLGNPGYSISVVLATLILSTGIGSYFSKSFFLNGKLTFIKTILYLILYLSFLLISFNFLVEIVLPLNIVIKVFIITISLFPLGFLMGQLFPQGLVKVKKEDIKLVPWAWAINGAASTIAVCLGLLMSQPLGFSAIIVTGAVFYMIILLLPEYRAVPK